MLPREDVIATFIAYKRSENGNTKRGIVAMADRGYEETAHTGKLLPDGREVFEMWGKRWVLRKDIHSKKLAQSMELAVTRNTAIAAAKKETSETKSVAGTDALDKMTCPKCGDALQYSTVCSACAAGIAGYRHRYSCVHGCVDFVSKEKYERSI